MDIDDDHLTYLILIDQDKRFIVTLLTKSIIRKEIQKVLIL